MVAMVSDLGGGNRKLSKELDCTPEKPWFRNPYNDEKIFVFADVPHLIKLIRNHFLDHGFVYKGKLIEKQIIQKLLSLTDNTDLKITHKISHENLNVTGAARQKVKLATKLFSHTVSAAVRWCGNNGYFGQENWFECAEFMKQVSIKIIIFFCRNKFLLILGQRLVRCIECLNAYNRR